MANDAAMGQQHVGCYSHVCTFRDTHGDRCCVAHAAHCRQSDPLLDTFDPRSGDPEVHESRGEKGANNNDLTVILDSQSLPCESL